MATRVLIALSLALDSILWLGGVFPATETASVRIKTLLLVPRLRAPATQLSWALHALNIAPAPLEPPLAAVTAPARNLRTRPQVRASALATAATLAPTAALRALSATALLVEARELAQSAQATVNMLPQAFALAMRAMLAPPAISSVPSLVAKCAAATDNA